MAETLRHDDFGEKIGGAKKDLWRKNGLLTDDLSDMNSREAEKYVRKNYVWKKPDYQAMIEQGIPVDVVFYVKSLRDCLDTAPRFLKEDTTPERIRERQKQYIGTIRQLLSVLMDVKTKADAMAAFERFCVDNGYVERKFGGISDSYFTLTEKGLNNPAISHKLLNVLRITSEHAYEWRFVQGAQRKRFGIAKKDKIPSGYDILFNDGKHTYSENNVWKPDTFYVVKGNLIISTNFESRGEALQWLRENVKQRGANGKKRFTPPQLEHIERDGPDYRRGKDVSGQDYLDSFGFRGGEFGNWMAQLDRQVSLNMGYDALKDLSYALKISDNDLSYQGTLSIAFGARGAGNFVAHYEPLRQVINLTKMKGAGSLAHEWWHGWDHFLGEKMGVKGMLSENPSRYPPFAKLIDAIKYKPETREQAVARCEVADARIRRNAESWLDHCVLGPVKYYGDEKAMSEYEKLKTAFLRGEAGIIDQIYAIKKSVCGRVIPKSERERLHSFESVLRSMNENREPTIRKTETDFYRNSKRMGKVSGKDGGYWDSNTELTARAFAVYVLDTLTSRSDYLVGHAECAVSLDVDSAGNMSVVKAFPEGDERKAINRVFDEIIADLKLQHYLTHEDKSLPEPQKSL